MTYTIYTDGGSRGNPGPGAVGIVFFDDKNNKVHEISKYIGRCTNNEAEYLGLIEGLTYAYKHEFIDLKVFMDSELIINQIKKVYKVKNDRLIAHYNKVLDLCEKFGSISFFHIKRENNKLADSLVNRALDNYGK